jgi:hypothetical protein
VAFERAWTLDRHEAADRELREAKELDALDGGERE